MISKDYSDLLDLEISLFREGYSIKEWIRKREAVLDFKVKQDIAYVLDRKDLRCKDILDVALELVTHESDNLEEFIYQMELHFEDNSYKLHASYIYNRFLLNAFDSIFNLDIEQHNVISKYLENTYYELRDVN